LEIKECTPAEVKLPNGASISVAQYVYTQITLNGIALPKSKFYVLPMEPSIVLGLSFLK
jgi:hypothetical protein